MNKKTVYLETSFISYLTNRLSRDLIVAAHQQVTRTWWEDERAKFELFVSDVVLDEIKRGDREASMLRQNKIEGLAILQLKPEVLLLAELILKRSFLTIKALPDALHMALGAIHGIDYVITWNFKHMANAEIEYAIMNACEEKGYKSPVICTPLELMGGASENG
jgi:predicted nucleic acid-binding protein